jgi:hypothetical protein
LSNCTATGQNSAWHTAPSESVCVLSVHTWIENKGLQNEIIRDNRFRIVRIIYNRANLYFLEIIK